MCLYTVDKKTKHYKYGYKIFIVTNHKTVRSEIFFLSYELNKWIEDHNNIQLTCYNGDKYETGFHTFTSLKGAKNWKKLSNKSCEIFKVEIDRCVASGKHQELGKLYNVMVTKKIKIGEMIK